MVSPCFSFAPTVGWVFYKDLHCPPATNHDIDPHYLAEIAACVDDNLSFTRTPPGTAITVAAKLLEVRHLPIRRRQDLSKVVLSSKRVWLRRRRAADPAQTKTFVEQHCLSPILG